MAPVQHSLVVEAGGVIRGPGSLMVGTLTNFAEYANISGLIYTASTIIYATRIIISDGKVSATANNEGLGAGKYANSRFAGGGGHGGSGGTTTAGISGTPYGSYIYPSRAGSKGSSNYNRDNCMLT